MTVYSISVFIHLVSALALFVAFGIEWTANAFLRRSTAPAEALHWLRLARLAPTVSGPALAVLILSGGYLASLTGAMKQGWIPASLLAIGIVFLLGIVVNVPRMRVIGKSLMASGEGLSAAARASLLDPVLATSVRVRVSVALGIVFLMATKLPLGDSLVALGVAAAAGLVLSVPVFRPKRAS